MASPRRRDVLAGALTLPVASTAAGVAGAQAQSPARPVRLLVGGAAGSVPDTLARLVAERLAPGLGQPVLVENRPGAGGIVAMQALVGGEPDGHTLALATMSQAVFNSYLFGRLPYDPLRDLEPIAPLVSAAFALAAHPGFAVDTLAGLVAAARAGPGSVFLGTPANGSPPHIAALMLARAAGIAVSFVPFSSGPDGLKAVLRGDVPLFLDGPTIVSPQVRAGALKALVVTGREREPELPGVPTVAEAGLPEATCEAWIGLVAPARTPPALVARLNREVSAVLAQAGLRERLRALSFVALPASPEEFRRLILEGHGRWGPAIRETGLKLD
jgi:tripartite-type tricarboxylate transporter receptor subunit TctC